MPQDTTNNIKRWGNAPLPAALASSSPDPLTMTGPVTRPIMRRFAQLLTAAPLAANATFFGPWVDTNVTGGNFVSTIAQTDVAANTVANGLQIQGWTGSASDAPVLLVGTGVVANPAKNVLINTVLPYRYWRVVYINGASQMATFSVNVVESQAPTTITAIQGVQGAFRANVVQSSASVAGFLDGGQFIAGFTNDLGGQATPVTVGGFVTAAPPGGGATVAMQAARTPNIYRGAQFSGAGANIIWTPSPTKKVRLMKYKIEVSEDATITSGPLPINLQWSQALGTATAALLGYNTTYPYTHRFVAPATVLATSGQLWESDWIDLGNGQTLTTAGAALTMGIQVPQTTGAITPTFTIASNQWEAATVGFKTANNLGNFKLIQQQTQVAAAGTVASAAAVHAVGDAIIVVFRTTNVVGGAPTVTVTDTAGNTYTVTALTTNATDGANGSSIGVAYAINNKGNAANIVTVATSVNVATQIETIVLDYTGLGSAGIDAALVGTTGNSTSPSSGAYTPATAGDLLITLMATSASLASQPTIGSNLVLRGAAFNATQGALAVADNFGNGALLAGQINVIAIGTEE